MLTGDQGGGDMRICIVQTQYCNTGLILVELTYAVLQITEDFIKIRVCSLKMYSYRMAIMFQFTGFSTYF